MGIKVINENKPNQLLGVIRRNYSFFNVFLIFISLLSCGLYGELINLPNRETQPFSGHPRINLVFQASLLFFIVVALFVNAFRFLKDAFLQINQISFPSLRQAFFNTLQVIFFTSFLVVSIWSFGFIIDKLLSYKFS
ncbi:Protein translocase subunit SecE [Candidatus Phytoplasma australiense]|uniref:Protein translocase subunit SecE n=2 Tax=Phytoplasma australiense TaxID=59748 RepID=B1VAN2_PHYAS|nr:preprotein translocase subunit SecE [Candidatus Phytoplasma australiense]AGL90401.1 Preprotein Translocase Subunit SecE [Strawberry lethal yellows phytoplasma (CPA) str. NZSb11]CAM12005.1 Protein translocase subunit SecE [Candidatus Phytoplasma australiense]